MALDPWRFYRSLTSGARYLAYAEALIASLSPKAVVIASTPGVPPRALLAAARKQGVPSIYFPHAALLADPLFNDLPVDFAGLRGEKEVELYADWGATAERLHLVGNPVLRPRPMPSIDHDRPIALAPPLNPPGWLEPLLQMVHAAVGAQVVVCPHPRADRDYLRSIMPPGWSMWTVSTLELLEHGPPVYLQHTSGSALESLYLGIPTVNLVNPDVPTTYSLIRQPYVHFASDARALRTAVAEARQEARDESSRLELRRWAEQWSLCDRDVATRGADLIEQAVSHGATEQPILDLWAGAKSVAASAPSVVA